ncbi:MAG: pyruvate ferredoxin oxidoreductase subunit gamma [Thermodesulfobacteriota bacterium]
MKEFRIHGRGGQGAVTTAELLALAAISEGKYAQAFPSFGPERRGAPVVAFARVSDRPIRVRSKVYEPDVVVVLDPSLLELVAVEEGLKPNGVVVANAPGDGGRFAERLKPSQRLYLIDASSIAREVIGRPITNTTMIGALVKATGIVSMESLNEPVQERFGRLGERNLMAMKRAYDSL